MSTPRMISIDHMEFSSWKTRSICPLSGLRRRRRRYWWRARPASTRSRVSGDTSGRPLRTLETVVTETPSSAAMDAMVVGRGPRAGEGLVIAPLTVSEIFAKL